jgi:hypothetical protein
MTEGQRGSNMDFVVNLLSFSTPTHTHDFDNHINGYGRSNTALMQSVSGLPEIRIVDRFETRRRFRKLGEVYDF